MKILSFLMMCFFLSLLASCKTTKTMSAYTPIINNQQGNPSALISKCGAVKIKIISWAEPNNGRMIWQADIYLNEEKINKKVYESTWNYINYSIDKMMIADKKENYWYIPVEGTSRIIRRSDKQVFKLARTAFNCSFFHYPTIWNKALFRCFIYCRLRYDLNLGYI